MIMTTTMMMMMMMIMIGNWLVKSQSTRNQEPEVNGRRQTERGIAEKLTYCIAPFGLHPDRTSIVSGPCVVAHCTTAVTVSSVYNRKC